MLHAVIQSGEQTAVHFFGEVNGYNLQTLKQFVRDSAGGSRDQVRLSVHIDPEDRVAFDLQSRRWLRRLSGSGTEVKVQVSGEA